MTRKSKGGRHRPLRVAGAEGDPLLATRKGGASSDHKQAPMTALLLTAAQVSEMLGCSRAHFYRIQKTGLIPGRVDLGGLVRYRRADIEAFIKSMVCL